MIRIALLSVLALAATLRPAAALDMLRTIDNQREYTLYVPESARESAPVVIAYTDPEFDIDRFKLQTRLEHYADVGGFLLVMPVIQGERWQDGTYGIGRDIRNDIAFTNRIVDELIEDYAVNTGRIYAAGMGAGGFMAHSYACFGKYRLAGIAVAAAALDKDVAAHCNIPPLDVIFAHGSEDRFFPRSGWVYKNSPYFATGESVNFWVKHNGCSARQVDTKPAKSEGDPTSATHVAFTRCKGGTRVDYFDINGGGHTWPGSFKREKPDYGRATTAINLSGLITNMAGR